MCGIAGIVRLNSKSGYNIQKRASMMSHMLSHRGPDYDGIWISEEKKIALVNTRLSIVDTNNKFSVPYISNSGNSILTYNGEIYNYKELSNYLSSKGILLKTKSDTEIMTEGLEKEGIEFIKKIDGFFSFALLDNQNSKIILTRDLIGEKSLFYYLDKNELIFCSEIAPIIAVIETSLTLDYNQIYSAFKYRSANPGSTIIKNINRLKGGESITLDLNSKKITRSFSQNFNLESWIEYFKSNPEEEKILDVYEENLYKSIKYRVPEQVGFSCTLSGGIDSALIGIFSSNFSKNKIKTIYAHSTETPPIREGDLINEFEASKISSGYISDQHSDFSMFKMDAVKNYTLSAKNSFDGVFCEGLPSFSMLAQFNKILGRKVLLLSDGPDDLLGGYEIDKNLCEDSENFNYNKNAKEKNFLRSKIKDSKRLFNLSKYNFNPFNFTTIHGGTSDQILENIFELKNLGKTEKIYGTIPKRYENLIDDLDVSQRMALSYASYSLPDHFNLRIDRGAMTHSVEARVPFQALSIVNMMIGTPMKWRYRNNYTKYLLRKIVERYIGKKIAYRNKYGFAQPVWKNININKGLKMREELESSNFFSNDNFTKSSKELFIKESQSINQRHLWMAYCAIQSSKYLKELRYNNGKL